MKPFFKIVTLLAVSSAACLDARAQKIDVKPLSVTTSGLANTLMLGPAWGPNPEPSAHRWVMNWTNSMAVSPDGTVFGVTNYEEGQQKVGIYKDGDNLLDSTNIGSNSVAVSRSFLVLGSDDGKTVHVLKRVPGQGIDGKNGTAPGTRRDIQVNAVPTPFAVEFDEKADRLYVLISTPG